MCRNWGATYREAEGANVERLSPVEAVLDLVVVLLEPLLDLGLGRDADDVDHVHCAAR